MNSDEPITLGSILIGALIAGGAAAAAKGIYDSVVNDRWDPEYIFKRDTANLIDSIIPGAKAGGLGNLVRSEFGIPEEQLDGTGLGIAIGTSVIQVVGAVGQLAGAAGQGVGGGGQFGGGGAGGAFEVADGATIIGEGATTGSEIAQATFENADAFNAFHNPLGVGLAEGLEHGLVDPVSGIVKTYGMDAIGSTAGNAGAAQGIKSVEQFGGAAPEQAIHVGTRTSKAGIETARSAMGYGDIQLPPPTGLQKVGQTISKVMNAPRDVVNAPFEGLGQLTHPRVGQVAGHLTKNVGLATAQEAGQENPDYGRAILSSLAGTAAGYSAASLASPGQALADELKARHNAHPSTIDPLRQSTAAAMGKVTGGVGAGADRIASAGVRAAMTPAIPTPKVLPPLDPYRALYPRRYLNRLRPGAR